MHRTVQVMPYNKYISAADNIVKYGGSGLALGSIAGNMVRNYFRNSRGSNARIGTARRQKTGRSMTLTKTRRRNQRQRSGVGVTVQHDQRQIYRRKPMTRFKRKRWTGFLKKVAAVNEKDLGTRTVLFNRTVRYQGNDNNDHVVATFALYGNESNESPLNDLYYIRNLENTGDPTAAAGDNVQLSTKFLFKSGIMDLTIRNHSGLNTNTSGPPVWIPDSRAKLELDVYEISMSKVAEQMTATDVYANYNNLQDVLDLAVTNERVINDTSVIGETQIFANDRGCTPFEFTSSLGRFGIKVWKKTKYFILSGDTITYQVRDPRRRVIDKRSLAAVGGFNRPGWTRIIYLTGKLVPGLSVGSLSPDFTQAFDVGVSRKYSYKIPGINDDRSIYIQA